jgi:hypothetical protein
LLWLGISNFSKAKQKKKKNEVLQAIHKQAEIYVSRSFTCFQAL